MWKQISKGSDEISKDVFWSHFDGIKYSGTTTLTN